MGLVRRVTDQQCGWEVRIRLDSRQTIVGWKSCGEHALDDHLLAIKRAARAQEKRS